MAFEQPREAGGVSGDEPLSVPLLAETIVANGEALARFGQIYAELDPLDTSEEERQRLIEVWRAH